MPDEGPRVFQPATLTIVAGVGGRTVYVGAVELTMVEQVALDRDAGATLFMRRPFGEAEHLRLDEEIRAAKSCELVTIRRRG